jgi:hypothetical protein
MFKHGQLDFLISKLQFNVIQLENVRIKGENRLTYPSLAFDNSEIEVQPLPEPIATQLEESGNTSTLGQIMSKLLGIGRSASSRMLKRSSSVPTSSNRPKKSNFVSRKSSMHVQHAESEADISSLASSYASSVALSEIAVEEHVPDMITQA